MELISILTELLLKVLFINLGKVMQIEGALGVDTLVQAKKLTVFFRDEGMSAVGADKTDRSGVETRSPVTKVCPQTLHWYWPLPPLLS